MLGLQFPPPIFYYIPEMADGLKGFNISSDTMPELENWLFLILQWLHSWRMPVFFTISGFFSGLILSNNNPQYFIKQRFIEIGITMVVFASFYDLLD